MTELKRAFRHRQVSEWLFLLGFIFTFGCFIAFTQYVEYGQTEAEERLRLTQQSEVIEKSLVLQITSVYKTLESVQDDLSHLLKHTDGVEQINRELRIVGNTLTGVRALLVVNASGQIAASNNASLVGIDLSGLEWFKLVSKAPNTLHVVTPIKSTVSGEAVGLVRSMAGPGGVFSGVIYASINQDFAREHLESVIYTQDARASMTFGDGKVFWTFPEQAGSTDADQARSDRRMGVFRTISLVSLMLDQPIVVSVSRERAAVFEPWWSDLQMHGFIFCVLALVSMLALYIFQRRYRVLEQLVHTQQLALQKSEARQLAIFDSSPDAQLISNVNGVVVQANNQAEKLLGYEVKELIGQSIEDLLPGRACEAGNVTVTARRKDGCVCDVEVNLSRIESTSGLLFVSAMRDIGAHKARVDDLMIAAAAFESNEGMVVTDVHGVILRVNKAFTRITGYSPEELIGKTSALLKSGRHDASFYVQCGTAMNSPAT